MGSAFIISPISRRFTLSVQRGPIHYVRTAEEVLHGLWIEGARHTQTTGSRSFSRYHLSLYVYPALLLRIEFHPSSKSRLNIPPRSRPFKAIDSNSIRQLDRRSFTIISNLVRIRASSRTRTILRLSHVCSPPRNLVLTIRFSLSISLYRRQFTMKMLSLAIGIVFEPYCSPLFCSLPAWPFRVSRRWQVQSC